jgi:hypothetical protein
MYQKSNLMGLVGGGDDPRFSPNKVIIFDEKMASEEIELEFRSFVRKVIFRKSW